MSRANVAATFMEHLCECPAHGYSQTERWGNQAYGICEVECEGITGIFYAGDRDCSSGVIDAWNEALKGTGIKINASYTGDMQNGFLNTGLFEWHDMSFVAQRGDVYLGDGHTAMCVSASPDMLAEFSLNEFGDVTGGEHGDQTGKESRIRNYYNLPWHGILHYIGEDNQPDMADNTPEEQTTCQICHDNIEEVAWKVIRGEYGNMPERQQQLEAEGYDYEEVRAEVNRLLGVEEVQEDVQEYTDEETLTAVAMQVIRGDWGNMPERKENLEAAGWNYEQVQARVNELC